MSGHNKWSKIKGIKEKNDQQNAKMFTKIGREIAVAVKLGGADPNSNNQLKNIIAKAKSINMPNDNINRSIKRASGELSTVNYESMTYEGYGVCGSAVIVYALTDNKKRTASDVRHAFDKFGGSLGSNGCVSYLFTKKGVIYVQKGTGISDDDMICYTSIPYQKGWEIYVDGEKVDYYEVFDALIGFDITSGEHEIEMKFMPYGMRLGLLLGILGLGLLVFLQKRDNPDIFIKSMNKFSKRSI